VHDYKQVIAILFATAAVLLTSLVTITHFAPEVSPVAMMATIGLTLLGVLAMTLGMDLAVRFKFDKKGDMTGSLGFTQRDAPPAPRIEVQEPATKQERPRLAPPRKRRVGDLAAACPRQSRRQPLQ
jgi:hypothetical protein